MHGPVSLDDSTSIEESHRLIDEAIALHQASVLALKSQKNSLAPISRLPPELLSQIFSLVKTKVISHHSTMSPTGLEWVKVTHVSTHWRHIAINLPSLWVDPPLKNFRWVQEMLQRSKDAGLEIMVDLDPATIHDVRPGLELSLKHGWRIKHLSFQGFVDMSVWNTLQKALPKSAPQLEHLCIKFSRSQIETSSPIVLSEEVFRETRKLRHLELSRCNINWNSHPSLLRSLTHLTLRRLSLDSKPTGKQFMDALKGMPDLQSLCLVDSLPVEQKWDVEQIHLTSLRTLSISSIHTEVETFFRCVTFPPTAMVHVGYVWDMTFTSHTDVSGIILGLFRSYSIPFHTLVLHQTRRSDGILLKLFTNATAEWDDPTYYYNSIANLEITFRRKAKSQSPEQYIAKLITDIFDSTTPLQSVLMHIDLTGMCELSVQTMANTFGILPQVCSVRADRKTSRLFLKALRLGSYTEKSKPTSTAEKLYFPNLSAIHFYRTDFWFPGLPDYAKDPWTISAKLLKDCIIQRSQSSAKIETLTFSYCVYLRQRDADSLSQTVDNIYCCGCDLDNYDNLEEYSEEEDRETLCTPLNFR
jgi:hypothetical protein